MTSVSETSCARIARKGAKSKSQYRTTFRNIFRNLEVDMFGSDGMVEESGSVFVERRGVLGGEEADGLIAG